MKLQSLELNGFKTFATKSSFQFDDNVTVIVGPNGSGKSNVADAVRWVLGEQSYKLLRGRKTVDMIFSGSSERARVGMASVTINFDNSEGWLPIDFSEVSITRRAYRDGKNEYFINGQQVLLRDVNELLGQSSLAERTYTIIGQGLVDAALALKAEERRNLFEEAAGIGLYRSRREDAERRLEKTHRNLDRVEDILAELKPRLRSLKRQARRAEQYDQVKADLQVLMQEWYGYHWARVQSELSQARTVEKEQRGKLAQDRETQSDLDQSLSEFQADVRGLRARLNSWHRTLSQHHADRERISRDLAVSDERLRSLKVNGQDVVSEQARVGEQIAASKERLEAMESEVQRLEKELGSAAAQSQEASQALEKRQGEQKNLQGELDEAQEKQARLAREHTRLQARREEWSVRLDREQEALKRADEKIARAVERVQEAETALETAQEKRQAALAKSQAAGKDLDEHRAKITQAEKERQSLREKRSQAKTEISRLEAEINVLEQAEKKLVGYASGAQAILKESRAGKLGGVMGALSSQLGVEEAYETAIAAALGEYLDAVILEKAQGSDGALKILLQKAARGALLPLDTLAPPDPITPKKNVPGVVGLASDLVGASPKLRPAVDLLLGQVVVVKDRESVPQALAGQLEVAKAVTLRGEVFYATGQIFAGQEDKPSTLSRSRQQRAWQGELAQAQKTVKTLSQKLGKLEQELENLHAQEGALAQALDSAQGHAKAIEEAHNQAILAREQAQRNAAWEEGQRDTLQDGIKAGETEIGQIREEIRQTEAKMVEAQETVRERASALGSLSLQEERRQVSYWETQAAVAKRALSDAQERLGERRQSWHVLESQQKNLAHKLESLNGERETLRKKQAALREEEAEIAREIEAVRDLIRPTEEKLEGVEDRQKGLQTSEAKARKTLTQAERRYAQAQLALTRAKENVESMQQRIKEDVGLVALEYGADVSGPTPLPLEGWVKKLPFVEEISEDLGDMISNQRAQLQRLGAVNPEARSEYHQVTERFEFMTEQLSDLRKAESDIKEVIAELELLMERDFRKTFNAVAAEFRGVFTRLFGGGEGRLVLTDADDLTRTGVDIEARLPGRRTQGLSLLSGGERSLTAAALIFSLLKVSPTPFCVLDEVDAMLDESNVARYREFLRELSADTQFIVITHNRNTVQAADIIYGITMAQDSTSQVLSLKLDEVDEVIE